MNKNGKMLSDFDGILPFFDYELNTEIPENIASRGDKIVWWKCENGHSYECSAYNKIAKSRGCSYCANRKILKGFNDLATTNPELLKDWDYAKNTFLPSEIVGGSPKKVYWVCNKCSYAWQSSVAHRGKRNHSCPACTNRVVIKGQNDVFTVFPHVKTIWDYNKNTVDPNTISYGANIGIWWKCENDHSIYSNINKVCNKIGCVYCLNQKLLVGWNDIATVRPDFAMQWNYDKNANTRPEQILISSKKYYHWICENGHSFHASPSNRISTKHAACRKCSHFGGFVNDAPGTLYFIENKTLKAYKIGITNKSSDRLKLFQKNGWTIVHTYHSQNGKEIRTLEKNILKWVRNELLLPQYLTKSEMGFMEGCTETFSAGTDENKIISKISELISDS